MILHGVRFRSQNKNCDRKKSNGLCPTRFHGSMETCSRRDSATLSCRRLNRFRTQCSTPRRMRPYAIQYERTDGSRVYILSSCFLVFFWGGGCDGNPEQKRDNIPTAVPNRKNDLTKYASSKSWLSSVIPLYGKPLMTPRRAIQ